MMMAQPRAHALAHVLAVAGDVRRAVGVDGDEDLGIVFPAVRHAVGAEALGKGACAAAAQRYGEHEAADAGEHAAPADIDDLQLVHDRPGGGVVDEGLVGHQSAPFLPAWPGTTWLLPAAW